MFDFALLPPEVNSARMYAGPGSAPMLAAAGAWAELAAELHRTSAAYASVVSGLTGGPWLGPASVAMAAAATPYVKWLSATAGRAEQTAVQARSAAAAHEAAFATTVPPQAVAANRTLLMSLIATNVFGQNTPAIAATEAEYGEMWGQDAAAMYGYANSSAAASALTPFTPPPPTSNPGGVAAQAATAGHSIVSTGSRTIAALPAALGSLASPAAADPPGLSSLGTLVTAAAIPVASADTAAASFATPASTFSGSASSTSAAVTYRGFLINADRDFDQGHGPYTGTGPGAQMLPQWFLGGTSGNVGAPSNAEEASATAGSGTATSVGKLSVPPAWASVAPEFRPVAYVAPMTATPVVPGMVAGGSDNLFGDMALAGMAGRAAGSAAVVGRGNERVRSTGQENKPSPRPSTGQVSEIAAELSELAARAQSLLGKLRDSGLMTDQEVAEQKRRFLGS